MEKSAKQKFRDRVVTILKQHDLIIERTSVAGRVAIVWILFDWKCDE